MNCRAPLSGKFCAVCGQRHDPHLHSLGEFLNEATETITHADSRLWRTLWSLMVKPGFLTREFFKGRRARYLPPFRLYLVLSVIVFLVASMGHNDVVLFSVGQDAGKPVARVTPLNDAAKERSETPAQRAARVCNDGRFGVPASWQERAKEACRRVVIDNGKGLAAELYHNIPRALFILLPLLALVMKCMYMRRYYVEHLLFFVHNHAFTFAFFVLYLIVIRLFDNAWVIGLSTTAMVLLVPYYTYRAMLRVYGQGKWLTRLKFTALSLAYIVCITLMAVATSLYSMIML